MSRFISIWFRHLVTDWFCLQKPAFRSVPFVVTVPSHGRMVIVATNALAEAQGVYSGMVLADARAMIPGLDVRDEKPELAEKLLYKLAEWCIRFTPCVAVDWPEGLLLDVTGCAHLWGGEGAYLAFIHKKMEERGYDIRISMADSPGAAWACARFSPQPGVIQPGDTDAIRKLPPEALRLETEVVERLHKLGLTRIHDFMRMPRPSLRRRFGPALLLRLDQALGREEERIEPVQPVEPWQERLPCLEPIVTATGIAIALERLLEALCARLSQEQKGLRLACFKGYRLDGKVEQVQIGTHRPSNSVKHLFKLFEDKLSAIEPDLGIELFVLEAPTVEEHIPAQSTLWEGSGGLASIQLSELIDRIAGKIGADRIRRYLPDEHYWPERCVKPALSITEQATSTWKLDRPRPLHLLAEPALIQVTAPIPDYPPMNFRHKGKLHTIKKADGPERIEAEWWLRNGEHRDYYYVEDEAGKRYWLFRLGHYQETQPVQWFLHGFFV